MSRGNDSGILSTPDEEARRESLQNGDGYADRAQTEECGDNGSNSNKSMSRLPQPDDYGYIDFNSTEDIQAAVDRKSTRLNSSHTVISYAVFCLKKKNNNNKNKERLPHDDYI